ncbi:hypothetical protein HK102_009121 [Quaeritorhiza haematococci]|nr:hypothetical protein HK102_009121 [Quaeritorhiza haematococci]
MSSCIDRHGSLLIPSFANLLLKACLCKIGRRIGFVDEALGTFTPLKTIHTFAPYNYADPDPRNPNVNAGGEYQTQNPNLSNLLRNLERVQQQQSEQHQQQPQELQELHVDNHPMEVVVDGTYGGDAVRENGGIDADQPGNNGHVVNGHMDGMAGNAAAVTTGPGTGGSDYGFYEVPVMFSRVFEERASGTFQLMTDGSPEPILERCGDYWDGKTLGAMSEPVMKKILEFYQNAVVSDMQVVAYAYRPIQRPAFLLPLLASNAASTGSAGTAPGAVVDHYYNHYHHPHYNTGAAPIYFEDLVLAEGPEVRAASTRAGAPAVSTNATSALGPVVLSVEGTSPTGAPDMVESPAVATPQRQDPTVTAASSSVPNNSSISSAPGQANLTSMTAPTTTSLSSSWTTRRLNRKRDLSLIDADDGVESAVDAGTSSSTAEGSTSTSVHASVSSGGGWMRRLKELSQEAVMAEVVKGQTFLGMLSMFYKPKTDVVSFIEDLGLGGIRFVYFSSTPERASKAYAERLGLEIDWNSCILLSSGDGTGQGGYTELHDIKARLPRGVENIRSHLQEVDDIPLHVSLFAECSPMSVREMVRIFQENGEVADIAVAVDPFHVGKPRTPNTGGPGSTTLPTNTPPSSNTASNPNLPAGAASSSSGPSLLTMGSSFITAPCALSLHHETSLYSLAQLIREARTLASNSQQDKWMFAGYYALRFALPSMIMVAVFAISLRGALQYAGLPSNIIGFFGLGGSWLHATEGEQWALLYAQNVTLFVYVMYTAVMSSTFLYRVLSILEAPPYTNVEFVKVMDRREWIKFQKRSKLEFNTKL